MALIGLIGLKIQCRRAETHGQLLTMSWEADCESGLHRSNQPHTVLLSTHRSPNCLICFPYQPGSCCFCIHLAETGELLSGTCWTPALPLVPGTLRLRWCWPGLHNASGLLHSMALNGVVKLVCHTHHTNIILMDHLCCRLQFVPVFHYNDVKWEWRQFPEVLWTGYYLCVSEMIHLFIS